MDIINKIDEWHENQVDLPRLHLGASLAGHHCDRYIWLSFRWAVRKKIEGRIKRLFRRGHNEEKTIIEDLTNIGFKIEGADSQIKANFGGHVSGSLDGIGYYQDNKYVLEFKTHSLKSFKEVVEDGVQKSKPLHYIQVQLYMYSQNIKKCLYIAICKDNDAMYSEIVVLDQEVALKYLNRAKTISIATHPPAKISENPSWYKCQKPYPCPAYNFCHQNKPIDQFNCRTCMYSVPEEAGYWTCQRWASPIPQTISAQLKGCGEYVIHPSLLKG